MLFLQCISIYNIIASQAGHVSAEIFACPCKRLESKNSANFNQLTQNSGF